MPKSQNAVSLKSVSFLAKELCMPAYLGRAEATKYHFSVSFQNQRPDRDP